MEKREAEERPKRAHQEAKRSEAKQEKRKPTLNGSSHQPEETRCKYAKDEEKRVNAITSEPSKRRQTAISTQTGGAVREGSYLAARDRKELCEPSPQTPPQTPAPHCHRSFDHFLGFLKRDNPELEGLNGDESNPYDPRRPELGNVTVSDDAAYYTDPDPGVSRVRQRKAAHGRTRREAGGDKRSGAHRESTHVMTQQGAHERRAPVNWGTGTKGVPALTKRACAHDSRTVRNPNLCRVDHPRAGLVGHHRSTASRT